ncbi:MAG: zinc ribbon domain-containing protein [Polyangiaceae bacterium]|nr:zinc ribbon domain-containing protein [Polyangiaceae bacterium]
MSALAVQCPVCGAPLRMRTDAREATCPHCGTRARVERAGSAAPAGGADGAPVIWLAARSGGRFLGLALRVAGALAVVLVATLALTYLSDSNADDLAADAVFVVDLARSPEPLDSHEAVLALADSTVVVASATGRLVVVDAQGRPLRSLVLPLPAPSARVAGLARDGAAGFFVSLGGAVLHVSGSSVGPALPVDAARRVYGPIASDPRGAVYCVTSGQELVRLGSDGLPEQRRRLALPPVASTLEHLDLAFVQEDRLVVSHRLTGELWWVDPGTGAITSIARRWDRIDSSVASLPDGSLVLQTDRGVLRVLADGSASALPGRRPAWLALRALASDHAGGVVALSASGTLLRYDATRIGR